MFQAILNVLAIIVLALVAGFIILLLVDLVLGCIDGKRGVLFFRNRKNSDRDNEILLQYNKDISLNDSYYLQNNQKDLALDFDKQYEKENQPEQTNNIDFAKAEEEQKLVEEKNQTEEPKEEVHEDFTFINKVSPEIEKELENENKEETVEESEEVEDDEDFDFLDDDDDDKSIEEILKAIKERNMKARNQFVQDEEVEADFDEDEVEESDEEKIENLEEEKAEVEDIIEKSPENSEEVEKLKAMVEELNKKLEEEQKKTLEIEEKSKEELENLKKELENKPTTTEEVTEESVNLLELELNKLLERQKQNEKDLKQNKKEYIPLARIAKTLESDQDKLRRREAIVAKKTMVMHGVNNYVVDEEKEQKLQEDIENLEGLRQSVQHCQEVMDANKDRYPILKRTNEILTRNATDLENDINELQEKIANAKEILNAKNSDNDNGTDNGTQE